MKPEVTIVSGFLGAGKTTFIQELIESLPKNKKVIVIENDFGAVNFDAQYLTKYGICIKSLLAGCICCSLFNDYKSTLKQLAMDNEFGTIIIEPSGVSKLSDIVTVVEELEAHNLLCLKDVITIVDASKAAVYAANFGEFYIDQLLGAQTILYSHAEYTEQLEQCKAWVAEELLSKKSSTQTELHTSHELFKSISLYSMKAHSHWQKEQWQAAFDRILAEVSGIIRIKGVVPTDSGYVMVQYAGNTLTLSPVSMAGTVITIIGSHIDEDRLKKLWIAL